MKNKVNLQALYYTRVMSLRFVSGMSCGNISKILPLSEETIRRWCIKFAKENNQTVIHMKQSSKENVSTAHPSKSIPLDDIKELRAELTRLKSELRNEKCRADLNEEIIKVAEDKFGIQIRKKAGAKQ